jgi:hypothetical protein
VGGEGVTEGMRLDPWKYNMKITFDLTHEWHYITAGFENRKMPNWNVYLKLSTTFLACYMEAIYLIIKYLRWNKIVMN